MKTTVEIPFTCPQCTAQHSRGALNGVDVYRCLRCGYVGFGFHPDPDIDHCVYLEAMAALRIDVELGLRDPENPNDMRLLEEA